MQLKKRLVKAVLYSETFTRVRHYRGHGIHSPFVYSIIRHVFMKRKVTGSDKHLYNALRACGVGNHAAVQLQNLHSYCNYTGFSIVDHDNLQLEMDTDFYVILPDVEPGTLNRILNQQAGGNRTVVIMFPRQSRSRMKLCAGMIRNCHCLSIDNRSYVIFFQNPKLPVQHFKL